MRRQVLLAVAVAAALFGLALAFVPGLQAVVTAPENTPQLLAGVAVLGGVVRSWQWLRHESSETTMPDRERGRPVAVPGDDFDSMLAAVPAIGAASGDHRALQVREDLREAAVEVLVRYRGISEAEANDRLAEGAWTDDRLAAEFFATVDGTGNSVTESVAGTLWGESPFMRRARRAAVELERIATSGGAD